MTTLTKEDWTLMRELMLDVVSGLLVEYPTKTDLTEVLKPVYEELNIINLRLEHMERRWSKTEEKIETVFANEQENRTRIHKLEQRLTLD